MGDLDLPKKCFARKVVKDEESVFTDNEVERISKYIEENVSLINYGILLAFQTGVRVGELCTLNIRMCMEINCVLDVRRLDTEGQMEDMYLKSANLQRRKLVIEISYLIQRHKGH